MTLMTMLAATGIGVIGANIMYGNLTESLNRTSSPSQTQIEQSIRSSLITNGLMAGSIGALLPVLAFLMQQSFKGKVRGLQDKLRDARWSEPLPKSLLQEDEFEQIGYKLEKMTARLAEQEKVNQAAEEMSRFINSWIASRASGNGIEGNENIPELLEASVKKARAILGVDRLLIYEFVGEGRGMVSYEAVNPPYLSAKIERLNYRMGETQIISNNPKTPENFRLQIRAYVTIPISNYGSIVAHQCSGPREWQETEINFLKQWAEHIVVKQQRKRAQELAVLENRLAATLKKLTLNISKIEDESLLLEKVVEGARAGIGSDRAIVYRFDENWQGTIITESVDEKYPVALNVRIADPCFAERYVDYYRQGRVKATDDIFNAGLTECHLKQLAPLGVKANLVTPIVISGELYGLLICHICRGPHHWEEAEINFLAQLATLLGTCLEKLALIEEQKAIQAQQQQERERMQQRAIALLMEIDPLRNGDLTIRASVTDDEIGTIADSYNSTIESLRKLVVDIQEVTEHLTETSLKAEEAIGSLNGKATRQKMEIESALERVAEMVESMLLVGNNAAQALATVEENLGTVRSAEELMNQSVEGMMAIQDSVGQTAQKIAFLAESGEKISKVVGLISRFAAQTHLLALKASIEAARAGEEGRGFAVIADEVRTLAAQSAEATAEISALVNNIQLGTKEVAATMEAGTQQVTIGASLLEETRRGLNQITYASEQINNLITAIAGVTGQQAQSGEMVRELMTDVAELSDNTMSSAQEVSDSFEYLLDTARNLASNVSQFKV